MEERSTTEIREDEIDLGNHFAILRKEWWKIGLLSLGIGFLTLLLMFLRPNVYQTTAVIAPPGEEKRQSLPLGALASFGIDVGGPSRVEDLETLFRSNDLTARVFRNRALLPFVLGDRFDPKTGMVRPTWLDRLSGRSKGSRPPSDWDAIRAAKDSLKVVTNRKTGVVTISFETPSAEGSANIVRHYLEEGKSRLQEEAFDRAEKNKKFIQEQIGKTIDALTRERLYALYGQEVEREMLARNREEFGFRVIDSPRIPDRKSRPARLKIALLVTLIAGIVVSMLLIGVGRQKHSGETGLMKG